MGTASTACRRCDGTGRVAGFGHVHNGVCYACRGSGKRGGGRVEPKRASVTCDGCGATGVATLGFGPACPVGWVIWTAPDRSKQKRLCGGCR